MIGRIIDAPDTVPVTGDRHAKVSLSMWRTVLPAWMAVVFILGVSCIGGWVRPAAAQDGAGVHEDIFGNNGESAHQDPSVQALMRARDGTIYAGTFGQGVFFSQNDGQSWTPVNEGLTDRVVLCLSEDGAGRVYAGTLYQGVFRSMPDRQGWERVSEGLKRVEVKALLIHDSGMFAGTGRGVYQWHEGTHRWRQVAEELDQLLVTSLAMADEQTLLAATAGKGLFRYDLRGVEPPRWQGQSSDLVDPKERLPHRYLRVVIRGDQRRMFVGTRDGGIFRSRDDGATWETMSRSLPNDSIRDIVVHPAGLLVGTGRGVFQLDPGTGKWNSRNRGLTERSIQTLLRSPHDILFAGTSAGLFRSVNHGETWVNVSAGMGAPARARKFF